MVKADSILALKLKEFAEWGVRKTGNKGGGTK